MTEAQQSRRTEWIHHLLLLLLVLLAYSQVSTFQYSLKWDAPDQYFPWRFYLSECIRNRHLPLWNPYQFCGYPFYADPQACAWYPVVWLFSAFGSYTMQTMQVEFLFYAFAGGAGMYRLVKSFGASPQACLLAAVSYSCCGFFAGNAQHFTWLAAAAWIPWIFWSYHRMVQTVYLGYTLLCALFLYLLLSAGYPAFITVVLYIMILCFIVLLAGRQQKAWKWAVAKQHFILAGAFVALGTVVFISFYQGLPHISRGQGVTLEKANLNPFSPQSCISWLLPYATLKKPEFYRSDVSMINAYFGLAGLVFLLSGGWWQNRKLRFVALLSLFLLLVSFGPYLPFRAILYRVLPLMNRIRFPALFRLFFLIGFILLAAKAFHALQQPANKKKPAFIAIAILFGLAAILTYSIKKHGWGAPLKPALLHPIAFLKTSTHHQHMQLQAVIQLVLLADLVILLLLPLRRAVAVRLVLIISCIDLFLATQLQAFGTIVGDLTVKTLQQTLAQQPKGFPPPDLNTPMTRYNNHYGQEQIKELWSNLSIFRKVPGTDGYNPFMLNNQMMLAEHPLHDSVWQNPYLYFSDKLTIDTALQSHKTLLIDTADYLRLSSVPFRLMDSDSMRIASFTPNTIAIQAKTQHPVLLTLQQAYFPGWSVHVDGKPQRIMVTSISNMSVALPAGTHLVSYTFNPPGIKIAAVITILLLLIAAGCCLRLFYRKSVNAVKPADA